MAGPFGHARPSKGGRCNMNGINLSQTDWRGTWRGEDVDTSNFEALGFEQGTIGFQVFEVSSNGLWNAAANPLDAPGIFPTDLFPNSSYFLSRGDNTFWFLPFGRILSSENSALNVKNGAIAFNWSMRSNGIFSAPTGSF